MKNRIDIEFVFILDIFYTFYKNEESHQTYTFLTAKHIQNNTTSQLVESYNKQVNATEQVIQTLEIISLLAFVQQINYHS